MVIAGSSIGATGLLATATGFGVFAGIHAASPGNGLQIQGDRDHARRVLRLARGMEGLGFAGIGLATIGTVLFAVGLSRLRAPDSRPRRVTRIGVGPGLLVMSGRF